MTIEAIGAPADPSTALQGNAGIGGQEQFLTILLSQLRFQDPLKPVDNQQLVAQLAQFSALEINRQQSQLVDRLLTVQAGDLAIGLIGQTVEYRNIDGSNSSGTVSSISFQSGEPLYSIRDLSTGLPVEGVRPSDILRVRGTASADPFDPPSFPSPPNPLNP